MGGTWKKFTSQDAVQEEGEMYKDFKRVFDYIFHYALLVIDWLSQSVDLWREHSFSKDGRCDLGEKSDDRNWNTTQWY